MLLAIVLALVAIPVRLCLAAPIHWHPEGQPCDARCDR